METLGNFIHGKHCPSHSSRTTPVFDPSTGEERKKVSLSDEEDVSAAVNSASQVSDMWAKTPPLQRARVMFRFKTLLEENKPLLARIISQEHGKVFSDALGELTRGIEVVEFACGIPQLLKGDHSLNIGAGIDSYSLMQPVGICVGITPFNFPAMVPMWMFPIALCCGNTFILKPSEKDPSLSLVLAKLLQQAGLPDGVFNVVNGDKKAVDALITHDDVAAVSFVGSTSIAEYIYSTASAYGKRCQALGGAKNHCIVMPDADIEKVTGAILGAGYGAAGERCMALSVVLAVGNDLADALVMELQQGIQAMTVGPSLPDQVEFDMGPVISAAHRRTIIEYIDAGVTQGATLLIDGRNKKVEGFENGFFVGPSLFDHVEVNMTIYREEIFGPVLCVLRVPDYASALALINQHPYGNGTAIFTRDGSLAKHFTENVQVGMVGVNVPIPVPMAFHCFGGWKRSIFGPLNIHGTDGVRFYTKMKTITSRWHDLTDDNSAFVIPTMK